MRRVAIVGISGSGKSTLANILGKKLGIPVFHLDKYYWDIGWKERYATKEEFKKVSEGFTNGDSWIIDGNYRSSIDLRFDRADTIIFLDYPKYLSLWRAFTRVFNRNQPFDKTDGVKERIDWALVKFIITYSITEMRDRVLKYKGIKDIYIIKSDRERDIFISKIS